MRASIAVCATACLALAGCWSKLEKQTKATGSTVLGKTTNKIVKFDPDAKLKVSDSKVKIDPSFGPLAPLQAYSPAIEQYTKSLIKHGIDLFHAEHGRYPKDHKEFMDKIINSSEGTIKLPVLPGNKQYQYDEKNHELVIVEMPATKADPKKSSK